MSALREELHSILARMDDNQVKQVLQPVKSLEDAAEKAYDEAYDPANDKMVGSLDEFFEPDTSDIVSQVKAIIRDNSPGSSSIF